MKAKHKKQELETGKNDCVTVEQVKEHLIKYSKNGSIGKPKDSYYGWGYINTEKLIMEGESMPTLKTPKLTFFQKIKKFFGI
jgi:hypothetical protein